MFHSEFRRYLNGGRGHAGQMEGGRERTRGDTFQGVSPRPPGPLDAKDVFLVPMTPEEKLGLRRSISARSRLLLIKQTM